MGRCRQKGRQGQERKHNEDNWGSPAVVIVGADKSSGDVDLIFQGTGGPSGEKKNWSGKRTR